MHILNFELSYSFKPMKISESWDVKACHPDLSENVRAYFICSEVLSNHQLTPGNLQNYRILRDINSLNPFRDGK